MKNLVFSNQIFTSFLYITVLAFYQSLGDQLHIKKLFFDLAKIVFARWKKPVFSSDWQKLANPVYNQVRFDALQISWAM